MSEAEYQRIVDDLKQSQTHRGNTALQALTKSNASGFMLALDIALGAMARGNPSYADTAARCTQLYRRINNLTLWQVDEGLELAAYRVAKELVPVTQTTAAEIFDRGLAQIEAALIANEQRPR